MVCTVSAGRALDEWMKQINEQPPSVQTNKPITLAEYKDGLWATWLKDESTFFDQLARNGLSSKTRGQHLPVLTAHVPNRPRTHVDPGQSDTTEAA